MKRKTLFWEYLEKEVEDAALEDQALIIQMDSNCYAGSQLVPKDPNPQNENGKLLQRFMERNPTLRIVNSLSICKGVITRQRSTIKGEEKAVLDFFIVNIKTLPYIESMNVDEKGQYRLTNFHGYQRKQKTTYSDHNVVTLNCNFMLRQNVPKRVELFNFKNQEGQQLFKELTSNTNTLTQCFEGDSPFLKQCQSWFSCLNGYFYKCFTKIRSRKRKVEVTEVDLLLDKRKKLRLSIQLENEDDIQQKIKQTEEEISKITN